LSVSGFSSELFFVAQLHLICLLPSHFPVAIQQFPKNKKLQLPRAMGMK